LEAAIVGGLTTRSDDRTRSPLTHASAAAPRDRLVAFWDGGSAACALPRPGVLVVGRSRGCDVVIDHPTVSREHVRLLIAEGVVVEDLGSSNGTRIGGRTLEPGASAPVGPGELVEVGSAVLVLHAAEAPAAPPPADDIDRLIDLVARSELSVVLLGETGVGKEVAAERIHRLSPRAGRRLVRLNCAALGESLLESELFGHERGAFTGAVAAKPGLLEVAQGGTVFFDEVAELPPATQAKLLRAIETREILRVGSVHPRPIDVRFVAATNRPLEELVARGAFRSDLYYRLAGITLTIPPLRERPREIETLARQFVADAAERAGRPPPAIGTDALARLRAHPWPGNVRELRHAMERAVVLAAGATLVTARHLRLDPAPAAPPAAPAAERGSEAEKQRILDALERAAGNQSRAAAMLGISRRTLINRLEQYGLPRPRKGG
jgi:DNA-binding NtrC family response regulator